MTDEYWGDEPEEEKKEEKQDDSKDKTLKDEIRDLNKKFAKFIEEHEVKEIKPDKVGKSQKKKGYVNFMLIRENGDITVHKVPVEEATTFYEKTPRLASPEYILNWKGNPTIIQPSWSSQPFSPVENFKKTEKDKMLSVGWRLLANRAELGDIKPKGKMSGWVIMMIIAIIGVVGYLLLR